MFCTYLVLLIAIWNIKIARFSRPISQGKTNFASSTLVRRKNVGPCAHHRQHSSLTAVLAAHIPLHMIERCVEENYRLSLRTCHSLCLITVHDEVWPGSSPGSVDA